MRAQTAEQPGRGATVALSKRMDLRLRHARTRLSREWRLARDRHPRVVVAAIVTALVLTAGVAAGGAWFLTGLFNGLPDTEALHRMTEMDQATAVFDAQDQLAFTIYKEQRIEVSL